jgi:hypothetical protein
MKYSITLQIDITYILDLIFSVINKYIDVLPSSLIDSNVSLKWKQRKSKKSKHAFWFVALWG